MNCTRRMATWPREQYETIRLSPTQIGSEKRGSLYRYSSTWPHSRLTGDVGHLVTLAIVLGSRRTRARAVLEDCPAPAPTCPDSVGSLSGTLPVCYVFTFLLLVRPTRVPRSPLEFTPTCPHPVGTRSGRVGSCERSLPFWGGGHILHVRSRRGLTNQDRGYSSSSSGSSLRAGRITPKRPCFSSAIPAVKRSLVFFPARPPLPNFNPQRPLIAKGVPSSSCN